MDKCRLCYTDPDPEMCQHIFNSKFKPPMWRIIKQISKLIITKNDPYTKTICGPCFIKLVEYSAFRKTILDTDYQLQHAEELLSKKTNDDCDYFEVHCTSSSSDSDDSIVKEEEIEIEENPLEIDDEIKEELNNSSADVIDNQNIKELTIEDGINNNEKVPACYTSPDDNSNGTNGRQSSKSSTVDKIDFNRNSTETDGSYTISTNNNDLGLTDNDDIISSDGNEISTAKDVVDSSKNFDDNISSTNSNNNNNVENEESDVEMNNNNRRKYNTRYSQRNKQSSDEANLYRNKNVHTDEKPFTCNICKKQFSDKANLCKHKRLHTDDNSNETNERQSSKYSTDDKIDFNRDSTETDGNYTISTNNNNSRLTVNDDIIPSEGNDISTTKDVVGNGKNFDDNSSCTNSNNDSNVENEESDVEISNNNRRKYNTRYSQRLDVDNSINITDKTLKKNSESTKRHRNARYSSKMNLKVHNRKTLHTNAEMQTPERPLKSNICNKQSSDEANLCRNEKVLTDNKSYRCNVCDKQFSRKAYLQTHKRVHTGEKPFKCNICKKQFSQKQSLLRHQRIHTGEKPFKCNICKKQFSLQQTLSKHQRVHTGEKPFKCNICKKQFSRKAHLRIHERIHTGEKPFTCNICKKKFSYKTNLMRHQKVHSGEKPFKCNICDKSFSSRWHLKDHLNIHTGQKPYCCNICNKMFSFRCSLNRHSRLYKNGRVQV